MIIVEIPSDMELSNIARPWAHTIHEKCKPFEVFHDISIPLIKEVTWRLGRWRHVRDTSVQAGMNCSVLQEKLLLWVWICNFFFLTWEEKIFLMHCWPVLAFNCQLCSNVVHLIFYDLIILTFTLLLLKLFEDLSNFLL